MDHVLCMRGCPLFRVTICYSSSRSCLAFHVGLSSGSCAVNRTSVELLSKGHLGPTIVSIVEKVLSSRRFKCIITTGIANLRHYDSENPLLEVPLYRKNNGVCNYSVCPELSIVVVWRDLLGGVQRWRDSLSMYPHS